MREAGHDVEIVFFLVKNVFDVAATVQALQYLHSTFNIKLRFLNNATQDALLLEYFFRKRLLLSAFDLISRLNSILRLVDNYVGELCLLR